MAATTWGVRPLGNLETVGNSRKDAKTPRR